MKKAQSFAMLGLNTRLVLTIAFAVEGLLIGALNAHARPAQPTTSAITVTVKTVEKSTQNTTLILYGKIIAQEQIAVYADMMQARITKVLVEEGDYVKAGQPLAVVDTALAQVQRMQFLAAKQRATAGLSQAKTALEDANRQLENAKAERVRGEEVAKDGLISKEILEQRVLAEQIAEGKLNAARNQLEIASADLLTAHAQLDEIDLKIKQAELIAPTAGTVLQKNAVAGQLLGQSSQPQFLLVKEGALEVDIQTTPEEAARLKNGLPVTVKVNGLAGSYPGNIRKKGGVIRDENQMIHIRVTFSRPPDVLPGHAAIVSVKQGHQASFYLPDSAIVSEGNQYFVYTVAGQKAKRIAVTVGQRLDGQVEIVEGITPGMKVIDKFASFVRDGEPVNIKQAAY